ncbi:MAG: histidine phosphatase family protein [Spirochaetes bacterium]|nr:histidine phosphatase family protein [Spirochaetota bacterium]
MLHLMFVRHADPDYKNDTITERGHAQARSLGEALATARIDTMYCSPLGRAQATMRYVAERKGMTATTFEWLRELDGCYGKNEAGEGLWAWNQHGVAAFADGAVSIENWKARVPYGEKMTAVSAVQYKAFDDFLATRGIVRDGVRYRIGEPVDEHIAFFCHEGFIKTLLPHLLQIPLPVVYAQLTINPSSRTTLVLDEKDGYGVFHAKTINDCSHYHDCEQLNRGK